MLRTKLALTSSDALTVTAVLALAALGIVASGCGSQGPNSDVDPLLAGLIDDDLVDVLPGDDPNDPNSDPNGGGGSDLQYVTDVIQFSVSPTEGMRPLTVALEAFSMDEQIALPEGVYTWIVDGSGEAGSMAEASQRSHVFTRGGAHTIALTISLAGLSSPVGCVNDDTQTTEAVVIVLPRISGHVLDADGHGVAGVTVTSEPGGATSVTNADGLFIIDVAYDWSGQIVPQHAIYEFDRSSRSYSNVRSDVDGQGFVAAMPSEPENQAPTADAGLDRFIAMPSSSVDLYGSATDDGLPESPGALVCTWSKVSGPGSVVFDDATSVETTATFGAPGTYELQLTANDGELAASDRLTVHVVPALTMQAAPTSGTAPLTVEFAALEGGVEPTSLPAGSTLQWDFGDGSPVGSGFTAAHAYTTEGTFTAKLSVVLPAGLGTVLRAQQGIATTVEVPGVLEVSPLSTLNASGSAGGPFAPASKEYTLRNTGGQPIEWTATHAESWASVTPEGGTLAADESVAVTVAFTAEANALTAGNYSDSVAFTNTTNGAGDATRDVDLTVNVAGGALTPIARWDTVPYQRIDAGQTLNVGVVAFSKAGIDRVEFVVSGQGYDGPNPSISTEMALNPQSGVWEYWTAINCDDFNSDGAFTVEASVIGKDGGVRDKTTGSTLSGFSPDISPGLQQLTFYANPNATLHDYVAVVDPTSGNDDTGVVSETKATAEANPFESILKAQSVLTTTIGGDSSGAIIYLKAGEHTASSGPYYGDSAPRATTYWLTIQADDGVDRDSCILYDNGSGALISGKASYIYIKNVWLKNTADPGQYGLGRPVISVGSTDNAWLWLDDCRCSAKFRFSRGPIGQTYAADDTPVWATNCLFDKGNHNVSWYRGCTIMNKTGDAFQKGLHAVNCEVHDIGPNIGEVDVVTDATYTETGHPTGHDYVIEKPGAFANYIPTSFGDASHPAYFAFVTFEESGGAGPDAVAIAGKINDDAIYLSEDLSYDPTADLVSGFISSRSHSDLWQWWDDGAQNVVVFNIRATDLRYQGIFCRPGGSAVPHEGLAFVNLYMAFADQMYGDPKVPGKTAFLQNGNHVLFWHITQIGESHDPRWLHYDREGPLWLHNTSTIGCVFGQYEDASTGGGEREAMHNHVLDPSAQTAPGTDSTSGPAGLDEDGYPLGGSPLEGRVDIPVVPVDLDGRFRPTPATVGAYERP